MALCSSGHVGAGDDSYVAASQAIQDYLQNDEIESDASLPFAEESYSKTLSERSLKPLVTYRLLLQYLFGHRHHHNSDLRQTKHGGRCLARRADLIVSCSIPKYPD